MKEGQWRQLLSQFEFLGERTYLYNDQILTLFEAEQGFCLPNSFRSFCEVFGPGFLGYRYLIGCPWPASAEEPEDFRTSYDLVSLHERLVGICQDFAEEIEEVSREGLERVRRAKSPSAIVGRRGQFLSLEK